MATITHVCTLEYVAKMMGEDPELLEAIVYNDDNLTYGSIISVYTGPDDTAVTTGRLRSIGHGLPVGARAGTSEHVCGAE